MIALETLNKTGKAYKACLLTPDPPQIPATRTTTTSILCSTLTPGQA